MLGCEHHSHHYRFLSVSSESQGHFDRVLCGLPFQEVLKDKQASVPLGVVQCCLKQIEWTPSHLEVFFNNDSS